MEGVESFSCERDASAKLELSNSRDHVYLAGFFNLGIVVIARSVSYGSRVSVEYFLCIPVANLLFL